MGWSHVTKCVLIVLICQHTDIRSISFKCLPPHTSPLSLLISFVSSPKFVNSKIRNFHLFPLLIPVVNSRPYFQLFYSASTLTSPLLTSPRHHASYFCFVPLSDEKTVTFLPLTVLYLLITIPHLPSMTTISPFSFTSHSLKFLLSPFSLLLKSTYRIATPILTS